MLLHGTTFTPRCDYEPPNNRVTGLRLFPPRVRWGWTRIDTRTVQRKFNEFKAKVEERRGPAGHSPADVPILDGIRHFHAENTGSFAIPAHKRGVGAPREVMDVLGEQVFWADQTMLNGVDNRHESWEVQTAAQNLAAEGARRRGRNQPCRHRAEH